MKCKHDKISILVEQDGMVADGFCPICTQEQLALAVKVIEAAERYLISLGDYMGENSTDELSDTIAKFKEAEKS